MSIQVAKNLFLHSLPSLLSPQYDILNRDCDINTNILWTCKERLDENVGALVDSRLNRLTAPIKMKEKNEWFNQYFNVPVVALVNFPLPLPGSKLEHFNNIFSRRILWHCIFVSLCLWPGTQLTVMPAFYVHSQYSICAECVNFNYLIETSLIGSYECIYALYE